MELLTVREYAEIKGCSDRTIRNKIYAGSLEVKISYTDNRTKRYLIPITALPPKLQRKYYLQKCEELPAHLKPAPKAPLPAQYSQSLEEFSTDERNEIELWLRIIEEWKQYRHTHGGSCDEADAEYVRQAEQKYSGTIHISRSILYRRAAALSASNLAGLVDNRGKWKKGSTSIPQDIQDIFMYVYLDERALSVAKCVEATRMIIRTENPELEQQMPLCADPFYRLVKKCPLPVATLARHGDKAYNDRCGAFVDRLYDGMESNDYWIADGHTFDAITQTEDGEHRHRMTLSAFIDARSGIYVGWVVTDNPSSDATMMALRKAIQRYGIPRNIYVDNGREYLNIDIGGMGHRTKKRKVEIKLPTPILTRLGIQMTNALPRNGQAKIIEREFKNMTFLAQLLDTYTGNTPSNKPEKLKHKLKAGKIPTDGELTLMVEDMIEGYFNLLPYNGKVISDRGKSRMEVYRNNLVIQRRAADEDLNLLMMRSTRLQQVGRDGVYVTISGERVYYSDDALHMLQGEKVYVRYDPENMDNVRVYDENEVYIRTVPMLRELMLEYGAGKAEISEAMAKKRHLRRLSKDQASIVRERIVSQYGHINLLDVYVRAAKVSRDGLLAPPEPKVIEIVRAPEHELPAAVNGMIADVHIDKSRMIRNIERNGF